MSTPSDNQGNQGNRGGATRGQDRAEQVQARNAERQASRPAEVEETEATGEGTESAPASE